MGNEMTFVLHKVLLKRKYSFNRFHEYMKKRLKNEGF